MTLGGEGEALKKGLKFLPHIRSGKPAALLGRSFALCKSLLEFHF